MNPSPFFSVVIPTYNCAQFLQRSISSVLNQSFSDFEIIIVDNSSTDDTSVVIKNVSDPRIVTITTENDGIIARSRNLGMRRARGSWIAFLDADDYWITDKLEVVRADIETHPEAILHCHDEWLVVDGVRNTILHYVPTLPNLYESLILNGNCLSTSAVVVRRDIALRVGGFSERYGFRTAEDFDFWIRLSVEGAAHFIPKPLGEYHLYGDNASGNAVVHADAGLAVAEHHLNEWAQQNPEFRWKVRCRRSQLWSNACHTLLRGREYIDARRFAAKAISTNPFNVKAWISGVFCLLRLPM